MSLGIIETAAACVAAYMTWRAYLLYTYRQIYGSPDMSPAFPPLSPGGIMFGLGQIWCWNQKLSAYKDGKETIRLTPWLWGESVLYSRSLEVLRQIGGGTNAIWVKPDWASGGIMLFGRNLLSENLDQWKVHRKIMQPAFNPKLYELVWDQTARVYGDMVETEKWSSEPGQTTNIQSLNRLTHRVGLYVISNCGFGLSFAWNDPPRVDGRSTLQSNIETVENHHLSLTYAPKWIWKLPIKALQHIKGERDSIADFINKEIETRKVLVEDAVRNEDSEASVKRDIFSRLVLANLTEGKSQLSNEELRGNTFALLFAGHESTAGTMAAAMALLAVHQDEQEKVYKEVMQVMDQDGELSFSQYQALPKTLAVFLEASRMYPAGQLGIRQCLEDTVLKVPSGHGETSDMFMPKGSTIIIDFIGMQYNPNIIENPAEFNPSRWEGVSEDVYSFSVGARACIGKKFAMTEAVCFMAHLLRDYKVMPLLKAGESVDEWKTRILENIGILLTLSIKDVPLQLIRR